MGMVAAGTAYGVKIYWGCMAVLTLTLIHVAAAGLLVVIQ